MTTRRLLAIIFIFICSAVAWFALGASLMIRTGEYDTALAREVSLLWGGRQVQVAPEASVERPREVVERVTEQQAGGGSREVRRTVLDTDPAPLVSTRAEVTLDLDQRRKGLLWYDTYGVAFKATCRFRNPDPVERAMQVRFAFPSEDAIYDDFVFQLDGKPVPMSGDLAKGLTARTVAGPHQDVRLEVAYRSRGLDDWTYAFSSAHVAEVRDFLLTMTTDFGDVDFPAGTMSPTRIRRSGAGSTLEWQFANLVTGKRIGMDLPNRINPGPLAARITFFAPVSLLFFLTVMVMLGVTTGHNLHPMHYFFLAAAFFAFHLLLAYLVDHVSIGAAFLLATATSLALVISYLRIVSGWRRALVQAGAAQVVFLVLFSYAFFFEGYTGLTVTVGAVATLFVLMQLTARVPWHEVFAPVPSGAAAAEVLRR